MVQIILPGFFPVQCCSKSFINKTTSAQGFFLHNVVCSLSGNVAQDFSFVQYCPKSRISWGNIAQVKCYVVLSLRLLITLHEKKSCSMLS